ncbi:amino acid transporter [Halobacillus litoralis]|uniref:Amino acid transporter n=1 Tax=Halobacillus litoralis TaxID=45668 RepID=A0A845DXN9_9BACI|nr:LysE family transporter [Halobacillus litoralis]MYL21062.1 amino acid transporter [Halobacillus litoralis]
MLFSYILLGLSLSAPVGPINAAQLDKGIRYGFFHAWLVGVGAMAADGLFMLLIYFGLADYIQIPLIKTFLWSFGAFVLIYTGVESIAGAGNVETQRSDSSKGSKGKSFRTGFFMALSNPLNILFWIGIYGSILAEISSQYEQAQLLLYSGGIFIGIMIWDITMAGAASGARKWLTGRLLYSISILSGIILIGFGLYFGVQAVRMIMG